MGGDGYTTEILARHHSFLADEPEQVGGADLGPTPYELLSSSLGACTAMTLQMYARRKKWDLKNVMIHLEHFKEHAADCDDCENPKSRIDHFQKTIELEGDLDDKQRERLLEIADRCPVHRTLTGDIMISTT